MTKILSKLFLCGIVLSSITYEGICAANSRVPIEAIDDGILKTTEINYELYAINFENNQANANNKILKNTTFTNNVVVGEYDYNEYRILNTAVAGKKLVQIDEDGSELPILQYDEESGKWYFIDAEGNYKIKEGTMNEKIELNKVKFSITPKYTLTLQNSVGGGGEKPTYLSVTEFGQLINRGRIEAKNGSIIASPAIELASDPEEELASDQEEELASDQEEELEKETIFVKATTDKQWNQAILNLNNVAIQNTNGIIKFYVGSATNSNSMLITNKYPIIQGGTIDVSDFIINGSNEQFLTIKSAFYNTNIILFQNINNIALDFNDDSKFASDSKHLFKNMLFFSDIKDKDGNITESRHSTVIVPNQIKIITDSEVKKDFNTTRDIVSCTPINTNNVLKLFYTEADINTFGNNAPLVVQQDGTSLYDALNFPQQPSKLAIDLFSFNFDDNIIDYNEIQFGIHPNLQFVVSSKYTGDKDLMLIPRDDSTEVIIGPEFNNYPGTLLFDPSIKTIRLGNGEQSMEEESELKLLTSKNKVSTELKEEGQLKASASAREVVRVLDGEEDWICTYKIKANDDMKIIANGNVNLILTNDKELKLEQLISEGSNSIDSGKIWHDEEEAKALAALKIRKSSMMI